MFVEEWKKIRGRWLEAERIFAKLKDEKKLNRENEQS